MPRNSTGILDTRTSLYGDWRMDICLRSPRFLTLTLPRAFNLIQRSRESLDFRDYAARSSQARRMTLISSGVGWSGRDTLNLAAMMTRRSLAAMSAVDGWVLVVYQGARAR